MAFSLDRRRTLLDRAALNIRPVQLTYAKEDGTVETRVIEIADEVRDGKNGAYFDAYCRLRGEMRRFRLDRIVRHRTLRTVGYHALLV